MAEVPEDFGGVDEFKVIITEAPAWASGLPIAAKGDSRERFCKLAAKVSATPEKYGVIFADPPWSFKTWSKKGTGRSAEQHYPVMTPEELKALPVADWAATDCALLMWIVDSNLEEALELIRAWGFVYGAKNTRTSVISPLRADEIARFGEAGFASGQLMREQ